MTALSPDPDAIERFVATGLLRVDDAFPAALAAQVRARVFAGLGVDPADAGTWTQPVARLGVLADAPCVAAVNTPRLHAVYDALVGAGRWQAPGALGTFPVRFPSTEAPGDVGWHVDMSFGTEAPDFLDWRINLASRGRALLLLVLCSDTGDADAPTRVRLGSHRVIARRLADAGDAGRTLGELAADGFAQSAACPEALATGPAGTVYACHPFLVHSAQAHRGQTPRVMAQPPLLPTGAFDVDAGPSPVERAIRQALTQNGS